jgi:D-sedoheptulose 7-phosphate isomerase
METMEKLMNESEFLVDYHEKIIKALNIDFYKEGLIKSKSLIEETSLNKNKVIIIGNGGSASIASHMAVDFSKNANIKTICFNDASLITCLSNDFGHDNWMMNAIRIYGEKGDCVLAISSSGMSKNIINAANYSREKDLNLITFSGMNENNLLKKMGNINFWVDSKAYNIIETSHQFLISSLVDMIIGKAEYKA